VQPRYAQRAAIALLSESKVDTLAAFPACIRKELDPHVMSLQRHNGVDINYKNLWDHAVGGLLPVATSGDGYGALPGGPTTTARTTR
jgi:hypothetical protein